MPHPAAQRWIDLFDDIRPDVNEGRRAGTAVKILVGTAHCELGIRARDVQRDRPRTMCQIPDHHCPRIMCRARDGLHIMQASAAVIHMGQHHHSHAVVDGREHILGCGRSDFVVLVEQPCEALRHI